MRAVASARPRIHQEPPRMTSNRIAIRAAALLLLCVGLCTELAAQDDHSKVVACFYRSWAHYRPGRGQYSVDKVPGELCTHLIYSFAGLDVPTDGIKSLDPWTDLPDNYGQNGYGNLVALRKRHPQLKVSLAIGGWVQGSSNFSALAADPQRRANFVDKAVAFIRKYDFDGLDFNWQYPARRGGKPYDKENFGLLIKLLREEFTKYRLLLSASLAGGPYIIDAAYDIPVFAKNLDFFHVQCYDYHGHWDLKTGVNAPLFSKDKSNVEYTIQYLIKNGAPNDKILMGLPFFGRAYTLLNEEIGAINLGSPSDYKGFKGPYTGEDGLMGYNEICIELKQNATSWRLLWDDLSRTPYASTGNQVLNYDDERSLGEKIKLAQKYRLGGVMIWALDTDDFQGDCSTKYPLLKAVHKALAESPPDRAAEDCFLPTYNHWADLFN